MKTQLCKLMSMLLVMGSLLLASGCGGGGGGESGGNTTLNMTYNAVTPSVNSRRIYAQTTIDNANNTINQTTRNSVTAVNADGSYVFIHDDPNGITSIVNGTNYSTITETVTENKSRQELSYSYTPANGTPVTCTFAPHGLGPDYPITLGQGWTLNFTRTCGTAVPISYTQTGSVVGIEAVTVPAGTFSAIKLQSNVIFTDSNGTTISESTTSWRDVTTQTLVKQVIGYTALVNGYPISVVSSLQSQSN